MDFLRSCYKTQMVLDASGTPYDVKWYKADVGAPLFDAEHFSSLNWTRPVYGPPGPGEVPTFKRVYYKGQIPSWIHHTPTFSISGLPDQYRTGAPAPRASPPAIAWDGSRTFPGTLPAGTFPPRALPAVIRQLTSSVSGDLTQQGVQFGLYQWQFNPDRNLALVAWQNPNVPFFTCYPTTWALQWSRAAPVQGGIFRCTSYNATTGISVWDDPSAGVLAAGETLTLHGV
jgi:hypothetical protein